MLGLQKVVRAIKNKFQDYKNVRGAVSEAETGTHLAITPSRLEGKFLSGVYTNSQGSRPYKLYVPGSYSPRKAAPLLVALHGCGQDPDNFAAGTHFNALAEIHGFLVLYPQQIRQYNSGKCWNWYKPNHQTRGRGEPAIIVGMVDEIIANYRINTKRIYVCGLSAGGSMAVALAICYPDYFAAVGVHSGLPYEAATNLGGAWQAMLLGGPFLERPGKVTYPSLGPARRPLPVIIFHGARDTTVNPINARQIIRQFARLGYSQDDNALNEAAHLPSQVKVEQVKDGYGYRVYNYQSKDRVLFQLYLVNEMGHAWSGGRKGSPATYIDPKGPDASTLMWNFFTTQT